MILDTTLVVQFIKFGLVGVLNTALHFAVFYALYSLLGLYYLLASTIGYVAGLINSYILNRNWTFRSHDADQKREFARFIWVNLLSLGVNLVTLKALVVWVELRPEVAQLLAIILTLLANFVGNRFWTFSSARSRCA